EVRPRSHLGRPSRHRDRAGADRGRRRALRGAAAAAAHDGARGWRHTDAGTQARRAGDGALRRRQHDRRPHGPRRRPRRRARRQVLTQTAHHIRHVREGGRGKYPHGGTVNYHFGFAIESMVSILLLLTILYCVRLNRQLRLLKADEQSLRVTISELVTATEIAERAIAGLKQTMREGEQVLSGRLQRSEELSGEIGEKMKAAETLLAKLARIAAVGRPSAAPAPERVSP